MFISCFIHLVLKFSSQALTGIFIVVIIVQAARALANLAAHGDSNSNNAAVGQEAGALEALVQLTRSPHDGVRWYIFFIWKFFLDHLFQLL